MPNSYKTLWWHMHKKSSYKLYTGDCKLFPLTFFAIVFDIVSNGIFIHTNDSMVAYSDAMCVLAKVINNGLCTIEGLFTMRNPVFVITVIKKLFESIAVAIFFATAVKFEFVIFI